MVTRTLLHWVDWVSPESVDSCGSAFVFAIYLQTKLVESCEPGMQSS